MNGSHEWSSLKPQRSTLPTCFALGARDVGARSRPKKNLKKPFRNTPCSPVGGPNGPLYSDTLFNAWCFWRRLDHMPRGPSTLYNESNDVRTMSVALFKLKK